METKQLRLPKTSASIFSLQLTIVFALVGLVGILNHEMWRDELQAWLLARDSASVIALFQNMRLEGHPALWHLCLYGLTRITHNPLAMQLFHVSIATVNVYLLARFSPFTRLQKTLLAFGYFSLYEYALISRSYALGVLLVFLFCTLYPGYQQKLVSAERSVWGLLLPFVSLGLLANTSVYGLFLSAALSIALGWAQIEQWQRPWPPHRLLSTLGGFGLLLSSWAVCYLQVRRVNAGSVGTHVTSQLTDQIARNELDSVFRAIRVGAQVWRSYIPVPSVWRFDFWNTNFLTNVKRLPNIVGMESAMLIAFFLSLLLILTVVRLLWRHPKWLIVYSVGTALMLTFSYIFLYGNIRHYGHLFILLLSCVWLAQAERYQPDRLDPVPAGLSWVRSVYPGHRGSARAVFGLSPRRQKQFFTGLLVLQMFAGVFAYSVDLVQPFSGSRATADFLRSHQLDRFPIFGYRDRQVSTVSGYLDQPIYYPNRQQFGSFWTIEHELTDAEVIDQIQAFSSQSQSPVVLVLTQPIEAAIPNINVEPLAHLAGKLSRLPETFYVYLARSKAQP